MKLTCTRENLKLAVFNSERVVSKQGTLPILNNILFEAEKGALKLLATNLEIGVETKIGAKIEKEGSITVPAKILSNFINNLSNKTAADTVVIEAVEQGIKIKSGSSSALIKGLPANDFPIIPKRKTGILLRIVGKKIKEIISQILTCVALNETRQELTGINIILGEKELYFAATDSFRLAEKKLELKNENIDKDEYLRLINKKNNIIVPANTLMELARIVSSDEEGTVGIAIEDGQIFFESGETRLISRLINGKYPEYKHIIPRDFKTRVVMEKEIIQSAVKISSFFSAGKTSEITIKIDAEKNKATVETIGSELGENITEAAAETTGPSQEVVFNSRYLLDGINSIASSKIAIFINNATSPVALKEVNEKNGEILEEFLYIVMPVKN